MIINQTDNCVLDITLSPSGLPGQMTLEIHRQFPLAQHPRWQRVVQITDTPCRFWEIGSFLHEMAKPTK